MGRVFRSLEACVLIWAQLSEDEDAASLTDKQKKTSLLRVCFDSRYFGTLSRELCYFEANGILLQTLLCRMRYMRMFFAIKRRK